MNNHEMFSAAQLAEITTPKGRSPIRPTDEQSAIIESSHYAPTIISAGAGSGKTETIAQRILWLVANGKAKPSEILGLTFTKKAASELSERIDERLGQLSSHLPLLQDLQDQGQDQLDVFTYHAFGGRIVNEFGLLAGISLGGEPAGAAREFQLAAKTIRNFESSPYPVTGAFADIVSAALKLASDLGEHQVNASEIANFCQDFLEKLDSLAANVTTKKDKEAISDFAARLGSQIALSDFAQAIGEAKINQEIFAFSDFMNLARDLILEFPLARQTLRSRYKFIFLDEYQDTSVSQVKLLSTLFSDAAVTAVGDPLQAIYEWRGAAADTMHTFGAAFCRKTTPLSLTLMTTWRNDGAILELANHMVAQVDPGAAHLKLRPGAGLGAVAYGDYATDIDEATALADLVAERWNTQKENGARPTIAILLRNRRNGTLIEEQLRQRDIPVESANENGLLFTAEISDLLSMARVILFPDRAVDLTRLLVGPRCALGARDLAALANFAKKLARDFHKGMSGQLSDALSGESDDGLASFTIIDALDLFEQAEQSTFSAAGYDRLLSFAKQIRHLRRFATSSPTDFFLALERAMHLSSELAMLPRGRANLDSFFEIVQRFEYQGGSLFDFMQWCDVAESEESGLDISGVTPSHDRVQMMTVHKAKGAEWDIVFIPGMYATNFPSSGKPSEAWHKNHKHLPLPFRSDIAGERYEDLNLATNQKELAGAIERLEDQWRERELISERRLAYVAYTRAKSELVLTSHHHTATGSRERKLGEFLSKAMSELKIGQILAQYDPARGRPSDLEVTTISWPALTPAQVRVQSAIKRLASLSPFELAEIETAGLEVDDDWQRSELKRLRALIAQRQERAQGANKILVEQPAALSASAMMRWLSDEQNYFSSKRRPLPEFSNYQSDLGTKFHAWVEGYFLAKYPELARTGAPSLEEEVVDIGPDESKLARLTQSWEASIYSQMLPLAIELPFEVMIEQKLVRGRIDAVFSVGDGYLIVDWKTGSPKMGEELAQAAKQLAIYRAAFAQIHGVDPANIRAAFYYVGAELTTEVDFAALEL